jgi:plastocyanin
MSRILPFFAVLVLAVAGTVAGPAPGIAEAQPAAVRIADFSFTPQRLTVPAGTAVTWTNAGNAPHTVTATNGAFDSKRLGSGGTFSFTFNTPGTYAYQCDIHPSMTGSVTVEGAAPAPSFAAASSAPSAAPPAVSPSPGATAGGGRAARWATSPSATARRAATGCGWRCGTGAAARRDDRRLAGQRRQRRPRLGELKPDASGTATLSYTDPEKRN